MARISMLQMTIFLAICSTFVQADHQQVMIKYSRTLDDDDLENKCGGCPCNSPCIPTPSPPPPSPPPPQQKPPPSNYCPPPPTRQNPPYIYINAPPGNVYPVYPFYSGVERSFSMGLIPFLITVMCLLAF